MGIANIINLSVLTVFPAAGLIIGLVKGFKNVKSWGTDYFLSAILTVGTGAILKSCAVPAKTAGAVILACAVVYMLLFAGLSKLIRRLFARSFERREDDMQKLGGIGVLNRILGGYALAVKGFVLAAVLCMLAYTAIDLTQIQVLKSAAESVYSGAVWQSVKPYIFDFIILGIINLALRHGYSSGISSALWALAVLGLLAGSGFAAYNLVFKTSLFNGASGALSLKINGAVNNPDISLTVAKCILTAAVFAVMALIVFVTSFFVSRAITFARAESVFYTADGILGAIALTLICTGAMMFLGYLAWHFCGFGFMSPFNGYFGDSVFAKYFYTENLLTEFGVPAMLPIREWFPAR